MLLINAIKLFHGHPNLHQYPTNFVKANITYTSANSSSQTIIENDNCAICDFIFAKNAEAAAVFTASAPLLHTGVICTEIQPSYISSFHSATSGRAPPALL